MQVEDLRKAKELMREALAMLKRKKPRSSSRARNARANLTAMGRSFPNIGAKMRFLRERKRS